MGKKVRLKGLFEYDVGENSVAIAERSPMTGWDYVAKVHRLTLGGQEFESKKSGKSMAIARYRSLVSPLDLIPVPLPFVPNRKRNRSGHLQSLGQTGG